MWVQQDVWQYEVCSHFAVLKKTTWNWPYASFSLCIVKVVMSAERSKCKNPRVSILPARVHSSHFFIGFAHPQPCGMKWVVGFWRIDRIFHDALFRFKPMALNFWTARSWLLKRLLWWLKRWKWPSTEANIEKNTWTETNMLPWLPKSLVKRDSCYKGFGCWDKQRISRQHAWAASTKKTFHHLAWLCQHKLPMVEQIFHKLCKRIVKSGFFCRLAQRWTHPIRSTDLGPWLGRLTRPPDAFLFAMRWNEPWTLAIRNIKHIHWVLRFWSITIRAASDALGLRIDFFASERWLSISGTCHPNSHQERVKALQEENQKLQVRKCFSVCEVAFGNA